MINNAKLQPLLNENPSNYADRIGQFYTNNVTREHKKIKGQFLTPLEIAKFMASFSNFNQSHLKILDPGCGIGILSIAIIERISVISSEIVSIELDAYETDTNVIYYSDIVLSYLKKWLSNKKIVFEYQIHSSDFILENAKYLNQENYHGLYNLIISNPPYFKLSKDDIRVKLSEQLVDGQPNIYSLFLGISSKMLNKNGELIFIIPRSFTSGRYFKKFRCFLFNNIQLEKIHLFESRKDTFSRDNVLQETLIIKGSKNVQEPSSKIQISTSIGALGLNENKKKSYPINDLINFKTDEKILHLPSNKKEELILKKISNWSNVLSDFKINISTGPVVSFRAHEFICLGQNNEYTEIVPLYWLHNINKMKIDWPKQHKEKGQYILNVSQSQSILLKNKNYLILRRFSTKDDKSRLIAAPHFSEKIQNEFIGIENKLNYIYRKGDELKKDELLGLCAFLNSDFYNRYFQIFNGNVNVSATEIREMKFPPLKDIIEVGNQIITADDYSIENINKLVNKYIGINNYE